MGDRKIVKLVYTFIHVSLQEDISVLKNGIQFVAMMEEHIPIHVMLAVKGWVLLTMGNAEIYNDSIYTLTDF